MCIRDRYYSDSSRYKETKLGSTVLNNLYINFNKWLFNSITIQSTSSFKNTVPIPIPAALRIAILTLEFFESVKHATYGPPGRGYDSFYGCTIHTQCISRM